jgi:hypothetical protein
MNILNTEIKQRAFDGKWELLWEIKDEENSYSFIDESGQNIQLIPTKWVVGSVYDYLLEVEN